jgi:hypothetical protein
MLSVVEMRWTWSQNVCLSHLHPVCEQSQGDSPPTHCSVVLSLLQGTGSLRLTTTTARAGDGQSPLSERLATAPPSGPCFCFPLQARVRKFGAKLLQLLAEWTETFPRDFEEESTIGHLTDVVGRISPCDEVGQAG